MNQADVYMAPYGPKEAALQSAALALRVRALRVRWLAAEISDQIASERLLGYATELEARAASEDSHAFRWSAND
jgi:hypothetical protein